MKNRKPLQVYLSEEERGMLEALRVGLAETTLSSTMKKLIFLLHNIFLANPLPPKSSKGIGG